MRDDQRIFLRRRPPALPCRLLGFASRFFGQRLALHRLLAVDFGDVVGERLIEHPLDGLQLAPERSRRLGGGQRRDLPKVTVTRIALHRSGAGPSQRLSDHFGLLIDLVDPVDA
jgi:hypothetical protein